jgi:hypothetical protein
MKKTITILSLTLVCMFQGLAQEEAQVDQTATIDGILNALYSSISGEKGEARDWDTFNNLFHPDSRLIPTGKTKEGEVKARFMSPQDYIDSSGKWLVENGFFEKEIHRTVNTFGHITQVFSTYESFRSEQDEVPFMRGINSIQLLYDGKRWWVINIYWQQESDEHPLPQEYLPH